LKITIEPVKRAPPTGVRGPEAGTPETMKPGLPKSI